MASGVGHLSRAGFLRAGAALALGVGLRPFSSSAASRSTFLRGEGFPYEAFDDLAASELRVGGSIIRVGFAPGRLALPKAEVLSRIRTAARAVSLYYGRFPVDGVRLLIVPMEGEGVLGGTTWGYAGGASRILLGTDTDTDELRRDWVITHEMVHLALPDLSERFAWLAEGLAVYIEPVARVQAGEMPAAAIWSDMKRDMPKGLPGTGDEGLDNTSTWGRIYWGGALFSLLADVRIRRETGNRVGLQDAMRGVLAAGGNHEVDWPVAKIFATAGKATGTTVLADLYAEMRAKPVRTDLDRLWGELGVMGEPGDIRLDDGAPLASIRSAITQRPAT